MRWGRVALSLCIVMHGLAGLANVTRESPAGAALRTMTKPWEKVLGVHQTWPMFVSPPRATSWLTFTGIRADGTEEVLRPLDGEPDVSGVVWVYSRRGKLERNAVADKREYLRTSVVRAECAAHPDFTHIRVDRVTQRTPAAWRTGPADRSTWPQSTEALKRWRCRR